MAENSREFGFIVDTADARYTGTIPAESLAEAFKEVTINRPEITYVEAWPLDTERKWAPLTFRQIMETSVARSARWHEDQEPWSISDWAMAMMGEFGEACNALKKLRRVQTGAPNINLEPGRQLSTEAEAIATSGSELAGGILYLVVLADRLGLDLDAELRKEFNKKSIEYGFPERL